MSDDVKDNYSAAETLQRRLRYVEQSASIYEQEVQMHLARSVEQLARASACRDEARVIREALDKLVTA